MAIINANQNPRSPHAPTIGIIGGGQLAKMLGAAAAPLGVQILVLSEQPHCPAAATCQRVIAGDPDELDSLRELARQVDVVTLENEFIDAAMLRQLEAEGHVIRPGSRTMHLVQDKLVQKTTLRAAGLAVSSFMETPDLASVDMAIAELGLPLVLKKRRNGYDGKGNATLRTAGDAKLAWELLQGDENPLLAEQFCDFSAELAVMITRSLDGSAVTYPVVETAQHHHICHTVKAPADIQSGLARQVKTLALNAVSAVHGVGTFGVELFLARNGQVLINELAPRVHNSGHYTIEACVCSQFENHIRAVLGWPLGSPEMRAKAAVMVNLLGAEKGSGHPHGIDRALSTPGAHVHVYGKTTSSPSRKMGHVTALGETLEEAWQTAHNAAQSLRFGAPNHS